MVHILIDNGHGVNTPGKRSPLWPDGSQLFEWDFNRKVAKKIHQKALAIEGLQPVLLVPEDKDIALTTRCNRANKFGKKDSLFISVHGNAAEDARANGWEVWTSPGQTEADVFATCVFNAVHEVMPNMKLRTDYSDGDPDKESKFTVLMKTIMPAILTENGFFTNYAECKEMMTDEYQEACADAHILGIRKYLHIL